MLTFVDNSKLYIGKKKKKTSTQFSPGAFRYVFFHSEHTVLLLRTQSFYSFDIASHSRIFLMTLQLRGVSRMVRRGSTGPLRKTLWHGGGFGVTTYLCAEAHSPTLFKNKISGL